MKYVGLFVTGLCLFVAAIAIKGFVLCQLWAWFIMDKFLLPGLKLFDSIGLALIVILLTTNSSRTRKHESFNTTMGNSIIFSLLALLCGWVYHTLAVWLS